MKFIGAESDDKKIYINAGKIIYIKPCDKGIYQTEIRYMTYRLDVAYSTWATKEILQELEL